jgi:hypothetical protein
MEGTTVDQRVDALAASQYGAIGHAQARGEGMTERQIRWRRVNGRWLPASYDVSVVAAVPPCPEQRAAVAVLRGPAGTVASHLTALALYGVCGFPARPHVTVRPERNSRLAGIHVHRSPLAPDDVAVAAGLPATSPARCLVDAAAVVGYERLCDLVDTTLYLRLTTPEEVRAAMRRASSRPGRAGLPRLEAAWRCGRRGPTPGARQRCA